CGAYHLAHFVEMRRIGLHDLRRKPARESGLDRGIHALLLRDDDALLPLLAARRRRLARRVAHDDPVEPVWMFLRQAERGGAAHGRPPKCAFLIASASISASASAISSSNV